MNLPDTPARSSKYPGRIRSRAASDNAGSSGVVEYKRIAIERVSTHPARLVLELASREWKRLRRDSGAQAAA
jgi:hypothetical protein